MKPEELTAGQKTELKEEQIITASGGTGESSPTNLEFTCPKCGSTNVWYHDWGGYVECSCNNCGYEWIIPYYYSGD